MGIPANLRARAISDLMGDISAKLAENGQHLNDKEIITTAEENYEFLIGEINHSKINGQPAEILVNMFTLQGITETTATEMVNALIQC